MAATRKSPGDTASAHPDLDPLRQVILLVNCRCGETHPILLTSPDHDELDALVDWVARGLQAQGITVTTRAFTSWRAVDDVAPRGQGFRDRCSAIARMSAEMRAEDEDIAF